MANDSIQKSVFPRVLLALLILIIFARFASLSLYPMLGTTEPRYAELARKMLISGDWVTLWVTDGVPLWGKPPLSFWADAASMAVFGINEFGARFAPFCASLLTLSLFWFWRESRVLSMPALIAALLYISTPMGFLGAGFVATDVYLTGGLALSMISFWRATRQPTTCWRWGFFIGIAIGLLAKGPLSVVLLVLSMLLWIAGSPKERLIITWQSLPWFRGTALTLLLALPWYLWAEHRTPGFLYHFIIGEHIERFLVKGWNGGRFAASHAESLGMIWWFFIESFVPWTLFVIPALFGLQKTKNALGQWRYRTTVALYFKNSEVQYLFSWILSSLLLFTLSRNILEAYVLPTLPAFAILFAAAIDKLVRNRPAWRWSMLLALGAPIVIMMVVLFFNDNLEKQSQRHLLRNWQKDTPLIYVGKVLPPSAIFYSNNQAQLKTALDEVTSHPVTVVMDGVSFDALPTATQAEWIMIERYDDFIMLHSHPK